MTGNDSRDQETKVVQRAPETGLAAGQVLRERFVLERVLGEGGMGRVFLAVDREDDGPNPYVAIKVLSERFKDHPESLTSLRREATNSRQLNHPNIVGVYHFDRDGPHVFMVMEYMRGQSLDAYIREHPSGTAFAEAWPIIRGCAEALAYMHSRNVVHSDFKPANIFLTSAGEAKVLDLGIARTVDETLPPGATRFDGNTLMALTPQYASCEMFGGMAPDRRDDIYALGCVAYELLTGRHPFDGATAIDARARQLMPPRPDGLTTRRWRALRAALAFDRNERTDTAETFLRDFDAAPPTARRLPWALASVALGVLLLGALAQLWPAAPDQQFLDQLLLEHRGQVDPNITGTQVARWLEQGESNRELARVAFVAGDYARGRFFLNDGASSARWVYGLVLTSAADEADKVRAGEGLLAAARLYRIPAEAEFDAGNAEAGLRFTCEGLAINAFDPALGRLFDRHRGDVADVRAIAPCSALAAR